MGVVVLSAQFYILFSLLDGEKHGYAIMKAVEQDTHRRLKLGPATLYTNLKKMLSQKLIEETEQEKPGEERRRYYRLTDSGRTLVQDELKHLEETVRLGQQRQSGLGL